MSVKVLINPDSGGVNIFGVRELKDNISAVMTEIGATCEFFYGGALELQQIAKRQVQTGAAELIVTAGGDGTVAAVCQGMYGSGVPLLPLPGGTMNLFARDMNIPSDLATACAASIGGKTKTVDLGKINERIFVNNVVFGSYGDFADARETLRDAETAAENINAINEATAAFFDSDPRTYTIIFDGRVTKVETNAVMIANNAYSGSELTRPIRNRIDRGILALYLMDSVTGADLLMRVAEVLAGRIDESNEIETHESTSCQVTTGSGKVKVAIDGDSEILKGRVTITTVPKAITVMCPEITI